MIPAHEFALTMAKAGGATFQLFRTIGALGLKMGFREDLLWQTFSSGDVFTFGLTMHPVCGLTAYFGFIFFGQNISTTTFLIFWRFFHPKKISNTKLLLEDLEAWHRGLLYIARAESVDADDSQSVPLTDLPLLSLEEAQAGWNGAC